MKAARSLIAVWACFAIPAAGSAGAISDPDDGLTREAVQPGLELAVERAIGRLLAVDLSLMDSPMDARILLVKVGSFDPGGEGEELDRAARLVARQLFERNFRVAVVDTPLQGDRGFADSFESDAVWELAVETRGSERDLLVRARGQEMASVVVPYEEKPWVTDFGGWQADAGGALFFRGKSEIEGSAESARKGALDAAVAELQSALVARGPSAGPGGQRKTRARLANELTSPIITSKYIKDWYLQESRRPYGSVYEAYVLLRVPEEAYDDLKARVRGWERTHRRHLWLGLLIFGLAIPVTFVAYLKLDAATRGCIAPWLRLGALATVVAVGIAVWWGLW